MYMLQQMPMLPITRHDWDQLMANNQLVINTIAELKSVPHNDTRTIHYIIYYKLLTGRFPCS